MNKKIESLIDKCKDIEMLDGRVLVHPLKLRTYTMTDRVLDEAANKGKNPMIDELKTVEKDVVINYTYQKAVVLNIANNVTNVKINDVIVYRISNLMEFDLIKGVSMLKSYEIVAILKGENI